MPNGSTQHPLAPVTEKKHIVGIDAIRLIAAILVMFFHYGFWVGAYPQAANAESVLISFPELYDWTNFGWIGVQIFFVISGFVIAFSGERASSAFHFLVTRVVRLVPAALICATITLIITLALQSSDASELFIAYLRSIFFVPFGVYIDGSYWTLAIEIAFYALVFLLIAIGRFNRIKLLAIAIGLQSTIYWVLYVFATTHPAGELFQLMRALQDSRSMEILLLHHGCFFAIGIFLWAQLLKRPSRINLFWLAIFVGTGCLQIYGVTESFYYQFDIRQPTLTPMTVWLGSLLAIYMAVVYNHKIHEISPPWLLRMFRTMGLMTYPLYLLHQTAGLALMNELVKLGLNAYAALLSIIVLAIASAWLVSVFIEPPLQRLAKEYLLRLGSLGERKFAGQKL